MKSLDQIIRELPSERRAKIAERADQLIAAVNRWAPSAVMAPCCARSPSHRLLRLADDLRRQRGEALEQVVHLLGGGRIDFETDARRVGEEVLVLHGGEKRRAQSLEPVRRNLGRAGERAA